MKFNYERHTLVLSNGDSIHVGLNGSSYVSDEKLDDNVISLMNGHFTDVNDEDSTSTLFSNVFGVSQRKFEDGWYITFFQKTENDKRREEVNEKINSVYDLAKSNNASLDDVNEALIELADIIGGMVNG